MDTGDLNGVIICLPLEHIGMGVFKAFFLAELFFYFNTENAQNRLYFVGMRELGTQDSTSTYSSRPASLKERFLDSLNSRGLTSEKIKNRFNDKNGITELMSKLSKDE